jgi:cytochrome c biogenesis factor
VQDCTAMLTSFQRMTKKGHGFESCLHRSINHMQVLSNQAVMALHLPLITPLMTESVRSVSKRDEVLWFNEARRITFCVASRAVLGDLLTREKAEQLFPLFQEMSTGALALVSTCCMHLASCPRSVLSYLSTGNFVLHCNGSLCEAETVFA